MAGPLPPPLLLFVPLRPAAPTPLLPPLRAWLWLGMLWAGTAAGAQSLPVAGTLRTPQDSLRLRLPVLLGPLGDAAARRPDPAAVARRLEAPLEGVPRGGPRPGRGRRLGAHRRPRP